MTLLKWLPTARTTKELNLDPFAATPDSVRLKQALMKLYSDDLGH